ncbi:MAG: hypothetical protein R2713_13630 [Ilumatobacteraceae bacterium]
MLDDRTAAHQLDPKLPTIAHIVPQHVYEGIDAEAIADYDGMDGVASGQYSLVEWNSGQDWTLERQPPNWFGRDNGIDRASCTGVNADALVAALVKGDRGARLRCRRRSCSSRRTGIEVVVGLQGGFTELALAWRAVSATGTSARGHRRPS